MHPSAIPTVPVTIGQRRWWLIPLLLWLIIVGTAFYKHTVNTRQQAIDVALEGARNMFRMVVITRSWNASHGGVYVPVTPDVQPNPYLEDPLRDVTTTSGLRLTKINPAYMTRLMGNLARAQNNTIFHLTSLRPIRPDNAPDDWERGALQAFELGDKEVLSVQGSERGDLLRYMAPLRVQQACLSCHAKQGYKVGDVRGGISVSLPFEPIAQVAREHTREDMLTYLAVFLLVAGAGGMLLELLRRRWFDLVTQALALTDSQRKLLQAEKMASVGQLAAGMAHEINNPLGFVTTNVNSLKGYTEQLMRLLQLCRSGQATQADFEAADLDFIQDDCGDLFRETQGGLHRVKTLVAQLKGFTQVDKPDWQWIDLNVSLQDTANVAKPQLQDKAELVLELGQVPAVHCVASHINQVVMALLLNAAQAIQTRGCITLRSGAEADRVWFEVKDNGCGMSAEVARRIFEPFFTTRDVGQGAGLGLSLAYDVVQAHRGRIEVDSVPGGGSTLRVWLPIDPEIKPI